MNGQHSAGQAFHQMMGRFSVQARGGWLDNLGIPPWILIWGTLVEGLLPLGLRLFLWRQPTKQGKSSCLAGGLQVLD